MIVPPPLKRASRRKKPTPEDYEAFRSSAGNWKDLVDTDKFIEDLYERRRISTRPSVDL